MIASWQMVQFDQKILLFPIDAPGSITTPGNIIFPVPMIDSCETNALS